MMLKPDSGTSIVAKSVGIVGVASMMLDTLPPKYLLGVCAFVMVCKAFTIVIQPPPPESKWAGAYKLVTLVAGNIGWAMNRFQVGWTGIMTPRNEVQEVKQKLQDILPPKSAETEHKV